MIDFYFDGLNSYGLLFENFKITDIKLNSINIIFSFFIYSVLQYKPLIFTILYTSPLYVIFSIISFVMMHFYY